MWACPDDRARSAGPCPSGDPGRAGASARWAAAGVSRTVATAGGRPRVTRIVASSRCDVRWPMYSRAWRSVGCRPVVEDLVLVDRPDERLVEIGVLERQACDVGQHQQRV